MKTIGKIQRTACWTTVIITEIKITTKYWKTALLYLFVSVIFFCFYSRLFMSPPFFMYAFHEFFEIFLLLSLWLLFLIFFSMFSLFFLYSTSRFTILVFFLSSEVVRLLFWIMCLSIHLSPFLLLFKNNDKILTYHTLFSQSLLTSRKVLALRGINDKTDKWWKWWK